VVFVTVDTPVQPQQVQELEHDELGHLAIFLVPIGSDENGRMRYEAVFN
jgi:hypothetical protein